MEREVELVRRMSRTNWMMVINLPLPFGVTKSQALQNLFNQLEYAKPLFDSERDLLACDILYVNKGGLLCNMTFFVAQRHYEHLMSSVFQRRIVAYNQKLPKGGAAPQSYMIMSCSRFLLTMAVMLMVANATIFSVSLNLLCEKTTNGKDLWAEAELME